jgi:adenylate kinase
MLREAVAAGSELGCQVREIMARGDLVGDALMIELVRDRLSRPDAQAGFVLDGFPRTLRQAETLDRLMNGRGPLLVIELVVPEAELVRRLSMRRICSACGVNAPPGPAEDALCPSCGGDLVQRTDDGADVVRERLRVYARDTAPLVAYYKSRPGYVRVDGARKPDEVAAALSAIAAEVVR